MQTLGLTEADLEQFEVEETAQFSEPDSEPLWDTHVVVYVELLPELQAAECVFLKLPICVEFTDVFLIPFRSIMLS